ncbi:hypothetical protein GCM10023317_10810 [Actinopolymorpha pittospori]
MGEVWRGEGDGNTQHGAVSGIKPETPAADLLAVDVRHLVPLVCGEPVPTRRNRKPGLRKVDTVMGAEESVGEVAGLFSRE